MIRLLQNHGRVSSNIPGVPGRPSEEAEQACETVLFRGSKERDGTLLWSSDYLKFYEAVAEIDVDDLDAAFELHNRTRAFGIKDDRIKQLLSHHTMSVGDLLIDENFDTWMVERHGFTQLYREPVFE